MLYEFQSGLNMLSFDAIAINNMDFCAIFDTIS